MSTGPEDVSVPNPSGSNRNFNSGGSNSPVVKKQGSYPRSHNQAHKASDMSDALLTELKDFQIKDPVKPTGSKGLLNILFPAEIIPINVDHNSLKRALKGTLINCPSYLPISQKPGGSDEEGEDVEEEDYSYYHNLLNWDEDDDDGDNDGSALSEASSATKEELSRKRKLNADEHQYGLWLMVIYHTMRNMLTEERAAAEEKAAAEGGADAVTEESTKKKKKKKETVHEKSIGNRDWIASYHNKPMEGVTKDKRKPDLCLIDTPRTSRINWPLVRSVIEITRTAKFLPHLMGMLAQRAAMILHNSPGRRFVPLLAISGTQFILCVYHRSGSRSTRPYSFKDHLGHFYHILAGFLFCDEKYLGYNPYITRDEMSIPISLSFHGIKHGYDEFIIEEVIFCKEGIQGRGTVVLKLRSKRNGDIFIAKFSWVDEGRTPTEVDHYVDLNGLKINGVPILYDYEDVKIDGVLESTAIWKTKSKKNFQARTLRIILLMGAGRPIWDFTSKEELISAIIDIVKAHRLACESGGILHRDISISNLLLIDFYPAHTSSADKQKAGNPETTARPAAAAGTTPVGPTGSAGTTLARGLLADYDYACKVSKSGPREYKTAQELRTRTRTGTLPFMAIEVLCGLNIENGVFYHTYQMDLESIVYVLLYICIHYAGPNDTPRTDLQSLKKKLNRSIPTEVWMERDKTWLDLGHLKALTWLYMKSSTLAWVHPYFDDMKGLFEEMEGVLFSVDAMREAQKDALKDAMENASLDIPVERTQAQLQENAKIYVGSRVSYDEFIAVLERYKKKVTEPGNPPAGDDGSSATGGNGDSHSSPTTAESSPLPLHSQSSQSTAAASSSSLNTSDSANTPGGTSASGSRYNFRDTRDRRNRTSAD